MEFFSGLGIVGLIALTWGTISLGIGFVIWACLVASKRLRPGESEPAMSAPIPQVVLSFQRPTKPRLPVAAYGEVVLETRSVA